MENIVLENPSDIIKQIHDEFDHAVNDIEIFAGEVQVEPTVGNPNHVKVLKEIGLVNNSLVKLNDETEELNRKREYEYKQSLEFSESVNRVIDQYKSKFPMNKFIFLPQVLNICEKYDLKLAPIDLFKGDIPQKNIDDIEQFLTQFKGYNNNYHPCVENTNVPLSSMKLSTENREYGYFNLEKYYICAPLSDFNYENKNVDMVGCELYHSSNKKPKFKYIKPQKVVIPDPIILKPVFTGLKELLGFLIITAWGDEAGDVNVVNEITN